MRYRQRMHFAAINDTGFNIMLALHLLTAFVAFAPLFVLPILGKQMQAGNIADRPALFGYFATNSQRIYGSALILSGLLGFGVAGMSDEVYKMSQGWLVAAFLIWIAMNGLLHALIRPSEKAINAAGAAGDAAAEKKLEMAGMLLTVLFGVQLFLMVFRPGISV